MLWKGPVSMKCLLPVLLVFIWMSATHAESDKPDDSIYPVGKLKPVDSVPVLKTGDRAPGFTLPAVGGGKISLSQYRGKKNVVISFVPAAWTPVCTMQWPVYDLTKDIFDKNNAILLGITVDNIPTLYAWTRYMSDDGGTLWFPVLSDFYPHGHVAKKYGVLRSEGFTERALFVVDQNGIIRYIDVHDINERPSLQKLGKALEEISK